MVQVKPMLEQWLLFPLTYVVDSGARRRVAYAERGETVGDLFLKTRAGRWRGRRPRPPTSARRARRPHARDVAFAQVVRPAHAGAGSSVLADSPRGTRGKVTNRTYGIVPVLMT